MNKAIGNAYSKMITVLFLCAILSIACLVSCVDNKTDDGGAKENTEQEADENGASGNGAENENSDNGSENGSSENGGNSGSSDNGDKNGEASGELNGSGLPTIEFPPIPFN